MEVTQLKPATRYYYRVPAPGSREDPAGWSPEYTVNTRAARGQTEFIRVPVKVLVVANCFSGENLDRTVSRPEPMSTEELQMYARAFNEASLFFWVNSRMKYWVDFDIYTDASYYRHEELPANPPDWLAKLPEFNKGKSWALLLEKKKTADRLYWGEVICTAVRHWQARRKTWAYSGSGGGTYGLIHWPQPGESSFLGGSDITWLTCHEFKHQIESQYRLSGLTREDDRMWFCHFAAKYNDPISGVRWKYDTAADHGEHYGGLAWQLRHMTTEQYLRNGWGELCVATDRDDDGIPDDASWLPLDEKRLGSNSARRDSDGDGLDDMSEVLTSMWVDAMNADPIRKRVKVPYRRPGLTTPDTDQDGIPDGRDPYPLYPYTNRIPCAAIRVDGNLDDWRKYQRIDFRRAQLGSRKENVDLEIRSCYDENWLYYAFLSRAPHGDIEMITDNDADGYYIGNDNFIVNLNSEGMIGSVRVHVGDMNCWPYEADNILFRTNLQHAVHNGGDKEQIVELAIPKRPELGLDLVPGETIGVSFKLRLPEEGSWVSVFEPGFVFDSVLDPDPDQNSTPKNMEQPPIAAPRPSEPAIPGSLRSLVDPDGMAVLHPAWKAGMFSSTDPKGHGRDCGNFLRVEGDRYVLADITGPGVITRMWSANPQGQLRIYLDGQEEPAVDCLFKDFFEGRCPPLQSPIVASSSGGWYSYWPIGFKRSCKVTAGNAPGIDERQAALLASRQISVSMRGVHELKLIVTDAGDGYGGDHADWADARLVRSDGMAVFLSDLTEQSAPAALIFSEQGWGLLE
ncbi:MAG: NPCBM/NEW2 domain-containing protein, partial [Pseudomonadota bacterium]